MNQSSIDIDFNNWNHLTKVVLAGCAGWQIIGTFRHIKRQTNDSGEAVTRQTFVEYIPQYLHVKSKTTLGTLSIY